MPVLTSLRPEDLGFGLVAWRSILYTVAAVFVINISITLWTAFYNLYLHPLRHIPGPKSWVAFPILQNFAQIQGRLDHKIRSFHEKYGEIVRCGPDQVTFTSPQAWKDIYGHGHAELPKFFPKGSGFEDEPKIISANSHNHFRFRRAMLPAFSDKALGMQEPLMRVYVDQLIEKLHGVAAQGSPTNIVKWYMLTTFDLIGDLAYGESFEGLAAGKSNQWMDMIENTLKLFPILLLVTASPILGRALLFLASDKLKKSREGHTKMATDLTMKRINNKDQADRGDFMTFMLRSRGKDHALSDAELSGNSDVLIVAGSETTATLLSGVTFHLLRTPEALEKCVREVREAFSRPEEITFKNATERLPYMLACLNEALRLFPPVPTALFRQTLPGPPTPVAGHMIPEGTRVGVHHLSCYHSPSNFHDPQKFAPERWLPEAQLDPRSPFHNDKRDAHRPFSYGPRDCIGRNLAYHEMRLILTSVLWHFDLELDEGSRNWAETQRTFALWEKPPMMCRLKERKMVGR